MSTRRAPREIPLRFDDGFRGGIAMLASLPWLAIIPFLVASSGELNVLAIFVVLCATVLFYSVVYLVWTHLVFTRAQPKEAARIAARQHQRGPGGAARALGMSSAEDWALSAGISALVIAIVAAIIGRSDGGVWVFALVLLTAVSSWLTMAYAFALRYFRLHSSGETIAFDIIEEPEFDDFLTMSLMISSIGAMSAGTPKTRIALRSTRTHTCIAFVFNALVIAMVVSLFTGFFAS